MSTIFWYGVSRAPATAYCSIRSARATSLVPETRPAIGATPTKKLPSFCSWTPTWWRCPAGGGGEGGQRGGRRVAAEELPAEVLVLQHLTELLPTPVGDEELQPGPRAQPAIAVFPEDRGHALPDVGHVLGGDPDAQLLGQHRVGRQATADPDGEPRALLRVHHAHEGDVVGLGGDVVAGVAGERGLVLARQVGVRRVPDGAALDLGQRLGAVDDLVLGHAGHG